MKVLGYTSVCHALHMNFFRNLIWKTLMHSGEKKLTKVIVPDKWKEGASNTTENGGRKINENKLLSKKNRYHSQPSSWRLLPCCVLLLLSK